MKASRIVAQIGLGAAVVVLAALGPSTAGEKKVAKLGEPVPDFTLVDTNGRVRTLSEYAGRIVVLEWFNARCPVVLKCYKSKSIQTANEKVRQLDKGIVWLAVNSTADTNAGENTMWIKTYELGYPILLDVDGKVGHQFDARRTPHMFVIDKKGILRYHGAIDNNAMGGKKPDETTNYVVNAVQQIVEGETVAPDYIKPYGCSVKYRN